MPLTEQELADRGEFGSSDGNVIVGGTDEQRVELWEVKSHLRPARDLTWEWEPYRGNYSEEPIRKWQEHELGYQFVCVGQRFVHPKYDWLTCYLDSYDPVRKAVVEIKTATSYDWAQRFYQPQVYLQRDIVECERAILLISTQAHKPVEIEVEFDQAYHDEIIERLLAFKICVDTVTRPHPVPPVYPPETWRNVDLTTDDPNWRDDMIIQLEMWANTKQWSDMHEQAAAEIKALLPGDIGRLRYRDITIKRNKRNALTIQRREAA